MKIEDELLDNIMGEIGNSVDNFNYASLEINIEKVIHSHQDSLKQRYDEAIELLSRITNAEDNYIIHIEIEQLLNKSK
jgi:hypothetical protein